MSYKDRQKQLEYLRQHYRANKQDYTARRKRRLEKFREIVSATKNKPCADCGKIYPYYVMDFDHVRGKKKWAIAQRSWVPSEKSLRAEIAKCDVVCSNCHRERTHKRGSSSNGRAGFL